MEYLALVILVLLIAIFIYKNISNKTDDKTLLLLKFSKGESLKINIAMSLVLFFLIITVLRKNDIKITSFWTLCSFFWLYVLNQKKIILEKGIGIIDLFKIKNYTIPFNTIHNIEPIKEDLFKITYMHRERFYVFKLYVSSDNVSEFKQIIRKKTKFKKI